MGRCFVATAGWAIPRISADRVADGPSHLSRYARVLDGVELNSTFHRRHRRATFERWARSVPPRFRFACKVPRTITHDRKLADVDALLDEFIDDVSCLGDRLGPLLVQLPGRLAYDGARAAALLRRLRARVSTPIVCEPRHASWYEDDVTALFEAHDVARVVADPPRPAAAAAPAGSPRLVYFRWHGAPRTYWSAYDEATLVELARRIREHSRHADVWCVFDNTAGGEAMGNALRLRELLEETREGLFNG